jgi:hypothetical protein
MSQQPVSFATLPREIRDRIYEMLFESLQQPRPSVSDSFPGVVGRPPKVKHEVETAILRVSRLIHNEAMYTLVQQNPFVRMQMPEGAFVVVFIDQLVPALTTERRAVENFGSHSVSYTVTSSGYVQGREAEGGARFALLLLRDLDGVCRSFSCGDFVPPMLPGKTTHEVVIHRPQGSLEVTLARQKRLLEPFRRHVRGLNHFSIQGHVDGSLAASVVAQVSKSYLSPDPDEVLATLRAHKQAGNECFNDGSTEEAGSSWANACYIIELHHRGPYWDTLVKLRPSFLAEIYDLHFKLYLNQAQASLKIAEEALGDAAQIFGFSSTADVYLNKAMLQVHDAAAEQAKFSSQVTWTPSTEQTAKLWYRKAKARRLMNDLGPAYQAIQVAMGACPNEGAIRREFVTIIELMGRQLPTV